MKLFLSGGAKIFREYLHISQREALEYDNLPKSTLECTHDMKVLACDAQ